jgi:hypothetical protein
MIDATSFVLFDHSAFVGLSTLVLDARLTRCRGRTYARSFRHAVRPISTCMLAACLWLKMSDIIYTLFAEYVEQSST